MCDEKFWPQYNANIPQKPQNNEKASLTDKAIFTKLFNENNEDLQDLAQRTGKQLNEILSNKLTFSLFLINSEVRELLNTERLSHDRPRNNY